MRHRRDVNNLECIASHRRALLRNMVIDLFYWTPGQIETDARAVGQEPEKRREIQPPHRLRTTPAKAKAARRLAEKMITLGKAGTLHARRLALARLGNTRKARNAVKKLFEEIAPKYAARHGGYTRILRLPESIRLPHRELAARYRGGYGLRVGDNAPLVLLELVEPEPRLKERRRKPRKARALKSQAAKGAKAGAAAAQPAAPAAKPAEAKVEAPPAAAAAPAAPSPAAPPKPEAPK